MQLWLLRPRDDVLARETNPWRPPWDKVHALVVRAPDATRARALAQAASGHEGQGVYVAFGLSEDEVVADVWLRPTFTHCVRLVPEGEPGVIVVDRREA